MFRFPYNETFEPSEQTKKWWLYTHKTEESFAGIRLPGLFQTTNYEWQVSGFFAIFILEGLATYWAWNEGVAITAILVSIFIDIFLAVLSHIPQKKICRLENENVFEVGEKNKSNQRKINAKKLIRNLFYVAIVFSAAFKFTWFYLVYMTFDSTALFILVCYLLGAILHITCTGYAIFTFIFNWKLRSEYNKYTDSDGQEFSENPMQLPIKTSADLQSVEIGRHRLVREDGGFRLFTGGVLSDDQLKEMVGRQHSNPEAVRILAIEGVRQQVNILKQTSKQKPQFKPNEQQPPLPDGRIDSVQSSPNTFH